MIGAAGNGPTDKAELASFAEAWEEFVLALRRSQARNRDTAGRLSLSQWDLLRALDGERGLAVGKLAEAAGITPATTTRVLDGLERTGVVERFRPDGDRRTVMVKLTPEGLRRVKATRRWMARRRQRLFQGLEPVERMPAERMLRSLAEVIDGL